jgi:dihydroorotate dehydrogenase electron transfer subunit
VRAMCATRGVPAQLALEAGMACGFGACYGCAVRIDGEWKRLCIEGPVVEAARVLC